MKVESVTLHTVGRCIYCLTTDKHLGGEHIVPHGIDGQWKLKKASCRQCERITSSFEFQVLRKELAEARCALNLYTKRKHKWPEELPIVVSREGREEIVYLPLDEHPAIMTLPLFNLPAYSNGRSYNKGIDVSGVVMIQVGGLPPRQIAEKYKADSLIFQSENKYVAFARLLAKIAYGFAVATYGLDMIEKAYVLPAIRGELDDVGRWVGCPISSLISGGNQLHEIKLLVDKGEILAYIRLFLPFRAPEYLVIVGHVRDHRLIDPAPTTYRSF